MKPLLKIALLISLGTLAMPGWAGCVSGDCQNGYGAFEYASGNRYEGDFINGRRHGKGVSTGTYGDRYEGDWVDGDRTGKGVYTWGPGEWEGDRYEGDYVDNKPHGKGVYTHANGSRYEGDYVDGAMHGKGVYTHASGRVESGIWEDNELIRTTVQDRIYNECLLEKGREQDMSVSAVLAAVQSVCQSIAVKDK